MPAATGSARTPLGGQGGRIQLIFFALNPWFLAGFLHTINPRFSKHLNSTNFHCKGAWVEQKCARADPKIHPLIGTLCFSGSSYIGVMIWGDTHNKFEFTRIMPGVYCCSVTQM